MTTLTAEQLDELERLEKAAASVRHKRLSELRAEECDETYEHLCVSQAKEAALDALPALVDEVRELRGIVNNYPTKSNGKPVSDARLRWIIENNKPGGSVECPLEDLASMASELRELRAYKQQGERVKACEWCGGHGVKMDYEGFQNQPTLVPCEDCGGFQ